MPIGALPKVGAKPWFVLRSKAGSAPSTRFTPGLVAAALDMGSATSARSNVLRPMRALGIFDEEGNLTPLGNKWRNESTYAEACQEILDKVYPPDLAALTDADGNPSVTQVRTWLVNNGFGESNARQMAATYVMIASKELAEAPGPSEGKRKAPTPVKSVAPAKEKAARQKQSSTNLEPPKEQVEQRTLPPSNAPGIHLDIQIHVPADASAEQIDAIFRSMAKHIYGRETD